MAKEKDLEKYGVTPKEGTEKYVGQEAFDLLAKEAFTAIHTKSDEGHTHKPSDIETDAENRFVSDEQITKWDQTTVCKVIERTDSTKSDLDMLTTRWGEPAAKVGDIGVVQLIIDGIKYNTACYMYQEAGWQALVGEVDANLCILQDDIILAGNYTQVGNITKGQTATATFKVKGKSVAAALQEILSKREQPKITSQPAVSGFALSGAKAVEVGTKIAAAQFSGAKLSAGGYTYGPATGIVAESWKVDRICNPAGLSSENVATDVQGTDDNNATGFIIGDDTSYASNVVSSLKYKITATHNEGAVALDNLKDPSNPVVKIAAGTKSQETAAYTGYRKYFWGTTADKPAITSDEIRSLTNSTGAYRAQVLTINVKPGDARVCIACIGTVKGVTRVINETALNADITATFVKTTCAVEGAGGYVAKDYNVWTFEPASPFENAAVLKVTLG